jgi:hypothetical protein
MEMQRLPMSSEKKAIRPTRHRYGLAMRRLIAYKIAAYAADVARHRPGERVRDDMLAESRYRFDWRGLIGM